MPRKKIQFKTLDTPFGPVRYVEDGSINVKLFVAIDHGREQGNCSPESGHGDAHGVKGRGFARTRTRLLCRQLNEIVGRGRPKSRLAGHRTPERRGLLYRSFNFKCDGCVHWNRVPRGRFIDNRACS